MKYRIETLPGIGQEEARALRAAQVTTVARLLRECAVPAHRNRLAQKTGIAEESLLRWASAAELLRIKGIGPQYSELLERSGVGGLGMLRQRDHQELTRQMDEINQLKNIARQAPSVVQVRRWVREARELPLIVQH